MSPDAPDGIAIRTAEPADELAVRRLVDGAVLAVEDLPERIAAGEVLLAIDQRSDGSTGAAGSDAGGSTVGAVVLARAGVPTDRAPTDRTPADGAPDESRRVVPDAWLDATHVRAIAVRRRRRGDGIGSALLQGAAERFGPLVADCDPDVAPFYRSVDAEIRDDASNANDAGDADDARCWALVERADRNSGQ